MKISYINLIADLCRGSGADGRKWRGNWPSRRIGRAVLASRDRFRRILFPKDLQAFVRIAERRDAIFLVARSGERDLAACPSLIRKSAAGAVGIGGKKIAIWGLAFSPIPDDIRFAPSLAIVKPLADEGADLQVYDPEAHAQCQAAADRSDFREDPSRPRAAPKGF